MQQQQNKTNTKPQANTSSKYYKDNTKKFYMKYTHIIERIVLLDSIHRLEVSGSVVSN
jgi:hypothetical protein